MGQQRKKGNGHGGNGKTSERRTGVDRRIQDSSDYGGPERRSNDRRRERRPDKPIKR